MRRIVGHVLRALCAAALAGSAACGDDTQIVEGDPDFFVTVQLAQNFSPRAVDRLELIFTDPAVLLDESAGEIYDGAISWETTASAGGDSLGVAVTGEYFQRNAFEAPGGVFELDVPFLGGLDVPEAQFRTEATALWLDDATGDHESIGFGTTVVEMPVAAGATATVEVACLTAGDWGWTCRTGCGPAANQCTEGVEQCGTGRFDCVEECCVPAD
jgi:hypothetical protein